MVVIVDESDQAEGGSRDQGSGDSGVTERMRAGAFNFWADNALRGKVLRIDSTNRVDLIDSAMRRSGRTDIKIPILMPDAVARRQIFEVVVRKHKLASTITDYTPFADRTDGYTGSDIELAVTTAYRFALRDGAKGITGAHLDRRPGRPAADVPGPGRHRPHDDPRPRRDPQQAAAAPEPRATSPRDRGPAPGPGVSPGVRSKTMGARREPDDGADQETEEHFRLLVESVLDYGIFMLDPDGRVASWNARRRAHQGLAGRRDHRPPLLDVLHPGRDRPRLARSTS